jgi:glycerol-3-phosphate acyltransferase PlsY
MNFHQTLIPVVFGSYIVGSIPTGFWLGKYWRGVDVRQMGSGNLGATNVFRVLGKGPGIVTLLIDVAKGVAPVLWVRQLYPGMLGLAVAAGLAAIVGHVTSIFVQFRGGKGVATSAGVFAALMPYPSLIALGIFLLVLWITRRISAGSIAAAVSLPASAFALSAPTVLTYTACAVACLVVWTHRANIRRIMAGTEPTFGAGKAA